MPDRQFIVESHPDPIQLQLLEEQINQYNVRATGFEDYRPLAIFVQDDQQSLVAGISGYTWGGCCEIDFLWVHPDYRRQGYGRELLQTAETEAANRGCHLVFLNSHNFEAPDFYQRLGYTINGIDENCPKGHSRYHLQKRLDGQL
jgi:ribosomal protein S18 acetylase RimI-like enzyme